MTEPQAYAQDPHPRPAGATGPDATRLRSDRPFALDATLVALLALICLGALLRFWGLGHQGLWYDESETASLVRFSPGVMLGLIPQSESTPPLYYCAAWLWVRVFGQTAAGLRSLSAVAGVLVIPVAYATAREMISRRAGLICAALAACSPLLVWYSQEARSYECLVLLSGLSLLAAARAVREPSPRRVALWALSVVAALGVHYFAGLLVVGEVVWLLVVHGRRRAVLAGVLVVLACGAGWLLLALAQNGTGNDAWIAHTSLSLRLAQIVPQFLLGTDAPARDALKFVAFVLAGVGLAGLWWAGRRTRRGALTAAGLAGLGFLCALVLVAFGFDEILTRNLLALWLPAAVAVSGGLAALTAPVTARLTARATAPVRGAGAALAAGLCVVGVIAVVGVATDARFQRPDWPGLARALGREPAGGQGRAVLIQRYTTTLPLSLSLPGLHELRRPVRVSQLDVIAMRSPPGDLCWWGAECNLVPSRLQSRYPVPGLHVVARRHVSQFDILVLRAPRPVLLTREAVRRALSVTDLDHDVLMVQRPAS